MVIQFNKLMITTMKKIISIFTIIMFLSWGCSDEILNEIDINKNVLNDASLNVLLPAVEMLITQQIAGTQAAVGSGFMAEHTTLTGVTSEIKSEMQNYNGAAWDNGFKAIRTLNDIRNKAEEAKRPGYSAISDILMAYTLSLLVDWYGDIPYKEAGDASNFGQPNFDKAEDLYTEMQKLLDNAIQKCDQATTASSRPSKDDLIFQGNMTLWKKTAYGLKARLSNRLSKIKPQESATLALSAIQNSFAENEGFIVSVYSTSPSNANPISNTFSSSSVQAVGNGIVNTMMYFLNDGEDVLNDPRAAIWFTLIGGKVVPAPNGRATTDITLNGTYYSKPKYLQERASPLPLLTYAELKFIEAEAQLRLSDKTKANTAYETAVRSALNQAAIFNSTQAISGAAKDAYIARTKVFPGSVNLTLKDIIYQKYISLFLFQSSEAYNDVRRTALFAMTDPEGTPKRYPYPQSEISRNKNAPQTSNEQTVYTDGARLFWALQ
jgi:hypothetical protein